MRAEFANKYNEIITDYVNNSHTVKLIKSVTSITNYILHHEVVTINNRLGHIKNKGMQQPHALSQNSKAIDSEKLQATHQVGVWWRVMIIPFRTV